MRSFFCDAKMCKRVACHVGIALALLLGYSPTNAVETPTADDPLTKDAVLANIRYSRERIESATVTIDFEREIDRTPAPDDHQRNLESWRAVTSFDIRHDAVLTRYPSTVSPRRDVPRDGQRVSDAEREILPYLICRRKDVDIVLDPYYMTNPSLVVFPHSERNANPHAIDPRAIGVGFFPRVMRGPMLDSLFEDPFPRSELDHVEMRDKLFWLSFLASNKRARYVMIVDPQKGWSPVRCFFEKGNLVESSDKLVAPADPFFTQDIEWQMRDGVWLPISLTMDIKRGESPRGERPTRENMVSVQETINATFSWEFVNQEVAEEVFDWHHWGLPVGMRVVNSLGGDSPREPIDFVKLPPIEPSGDIHGGTANWVKLLVLVCLSIFGFLVWRRSTRHQPTG